MAVTGKIDRKYMAHYIDAGSLCGGLTPKYERLGKDLEEYNVELNPDTETSKNILGESTFKHNGYEVSSDADPFYADTTSDLFTALQKIVDGRLKDDNLKTKAVAFYLGGSINIGYTVTTSALPDGITVSNSDRTVTIKSTKTQMITCFYAFL